MCIGNNKGAVTFWNLLIFKFSPITAICSTRTSFTVLEGSSCHASSRMLPALYCQNLLPAQQLQLRSSGTSRSLQRSLSQSLLLRQQRFVSSLQQRGRDPSAAIRPAFFSAFACPFFLRNSTAASMSPSVAVSAFCSPSYQRRSSLLTLLPLQL